MSKISKSIDDALGDADKLMNQATTIIDEPGDFIVALLTAHERIVDARRAQPKLPDGAVKGWCASAVTERYRRLTSLFRRLASGDGVPDEQPSVSYDEQQSEQANEE